MSRFGYIWILFSVGLALGVVAYDGHRRDVDIHDATRGALYTGVRAGCDRDNDLRIRAGLPTVDCRQMALDLVEDYLQSKP